jgi:polyisoprenyl-teichoic acid--peptidoglycan teichoic acid transferase
VNLEGFKDLVDAFGGVTLNVREPIPVGLPHESYFRYVEPGTHTLDGTETLWFARARYGSDDYSRMARQKCVMNAMLHQVTPQSAFRNFSKIAKASSEMVSTSIPTSEVNLFLELGMKASKQQVSTVSLVPPHVNTADPDIDAVHEMIALAIDRTEGDAPPVEKSKKAKKKQQAGATTGGSIGSLAEGYAANQAADLGASC